MKILVNLICQNSSPELPGLLESLKGRVDGLVAVDGGSKDNTVDLLKAWGAEDGTPVFVKTNPWPDDFSLQRNLCLNVTRAEYGIATPDNDIWVLMIDDDDTLVDFDREYLEKATSQCGVVGLSCRMDNADGFFNALQFFRLTSDVVWCNPIHEYVQLSGPKGLPPEGKLTIKRGRSSKHAADPLRNVRIGGKFVETCPRDGRARFYLARDILECEVMKNERGRAEAEGHLRMYLAMKDGFLAQDRYAQLLLVRLLCDTGRRQEARTMLMNIIATDPDNRSAYEAMSRVSDGKESGVWGRLAASAEGGCILPYSSKLPERVTPAHAQEAATS